MYHVRIGPTRANQGSGGLGFSACETFGVVAE
jgi:hypothetical protein